MLVAADISSEGDACLGGTEFVSRRLIQRGFVPRNNNDIRTSPSVWSKKMGVRIEGIFANSVPDRE